MNLPTSNGSGGRAVVAVFDFDGTLTRRGSVLPFLINLRGLLPVAAAAVRTFPKLLRGAIIGGTAADESKEELFIRLLAGVPQDRLERVSVAFAEHHMAHAQRPTVVRRLQWHRERGHYVVIVSASPESYVRRAGELLKVDGALATRLAVSGGLLTGRYEGKNCRGQEKYTRLTQWLRMNEIGGNGSNRPVIWAYGNSRGDLRMFAAADHAVDVGRLGRFGALRRYPRLTAVQARERHIDPERAKRSSVD
jgi:HAD superfamily hydrolase (TIGR01490 family)